MKIIYFEPKHCTDIHLIHLFRKNTYCSSWRLENKCFVLYTCIFIAKQKRHSVSWMYSVARFCHMFQYSLFIHVNIVNTFVLCAMAVISCALLSSYWAVTFSCCDWCKHEYECSMWLCLIVSMFVICSIYILSLVFSAVSQF